MSGDDHNNTTKTEWCPCGSGELRAECCAPMQPPWGGCVVSGDQLDLDGVAAVVYEGNQADVEHVKDRDDLFGMWCAQLESDYPAWHMVEFEGVAYTTDSPEFREFEREWDRRAQEQRPPLVPTPVWVEVLGPKPDRWGREEWFVGDRLTEAADPEPVVAEWVARVGRGRVRVRRALP